MPGSLFGSFTDALGKRFLLTSWLPSLLLIGAILTEVAVAAGVSRVTSWVQSFPGLIQAAGVALILLVVTLVATLLAVSTTSLLRFCEGYWGNGRLYRHIGLRRRAHYSQVIEALDTDAGYGRLYRQFPPPDLRDRAMPTRVGNILLSAELYPLVRYGIDAVLVWPRLYQAAPDSFRDRLAAAASVMEQMVSLIACGLVFAGVGTVTALVLLPWYAAPICVAAGLVLAAVAYRGLLSSCAPYAETVRTGFDLYRNSLITAIGWNAAPDLPAERYQWKQIGDLWLRGSPDDLTALGYRPFPASFRIPPNQPPIVSPPPPAEGGEKPLVHLWRWISVITLVALLLVSVIGAARERVLSPSPFPAVSVVTAVGPLPAFSAVRAEQLRVDHTGWSPFLSGAASPSQVTGHVMLSEVAAGQPVPAGQIGPVIPAGTVAVSATLSPAESLAGQVHPGDQVDVIPVCSDRPAKTITALTKITVLDVEDKPAAARAPPASVTMILAVPASLAAQAARTLLTCQVSIRPTADQAPGS